MKISIIVPVYNVEEYLSVCLESIFPAVGHDDEIILSLGNSQDGSTDLCYRFAQDHKQIKLIHQSGKGLSNARNCAIREATGDYILCIDSDDLVDPDLFSEMLDRIRGGEIHEDVIAHDYYRLDRRTGKTIPFFQIGDVPDQVGLHFLPQMIRKRECFWNVWRFIYKKSFLDKNDISYRENSLSEDVDYTANVFLAAPSIRFTHCPFYTYTVGRGDSLMDRPDFKRLSDTVNVLKDSILSLKESNLDYAPTMAARFQFEYILNMALVVEIDEKDRKMARELYQDWACVLSRSEDKMVCMMAAIMHIAGIQLMSYGLHILKLMRRWMIRHMN